MRKPAFTILLLLLFTLPSLAQKASISGRIVDTSDKKNLYLASVSLLRKVDTTLVAYTRTDKLGRFVFPKTDTGKYVILVTYPHFADFMEGLNLRSDLVIADVSMTPTSKLLDAVIVKSSGSMRIKGDT